ncbi:DUF4179 domain-containing protein [Alkalihalobacterium bogoriense]|uniref:DUF4179 domain-containing protein n=1 Tax=Alkalihalobacterium bogoriense TaxID=246272 RepID=UPI00047D6076|nr:DUF4179 domain-containing protein [Alkalihalobacterium bogoriense]
MPNDKEREMLESAAKLNQQPLPANIDHFIQAGLYKATKENKRKRQQKWVLLTASFFFLIMVTSIRVSPTFAAFVSEIPGGKWVVELVHYDKGLQAAIEHDYAIPLGVSDEHDGIKVTMEGMTIDEARLVLFYSIENKAGYSHLSFDEQFSISPDAFIAGLSYGGFSDIEKEKVVYGTIDINIGNPDEIPEQLEIKSGMAVEHKKKEGKSDSIWEFVIPVEKEAFLAKKETYKIDETVLFAEQTIVIEQATIHPTLMSLELTIPESNSKHLFSFEEISVVNEKGDRWKPLTNGVVGKVDGEKKTLYMESSYFAKAKELYLEVTRIRALDKKDAKVTVNLKEGKIIDGPDAISLVDVENYSSYSNLIFHVEYDEFYDKEDQFSVFGHSVQDINGKEIGSVEGWAMESTEGQLVVKHSFPVTHNGEEDIIMIELSDYPERIEDTMRVRLK